MLPVKLEVGIYPSALLLASAYGLLIALIFILWPLGRASQIRAGELLREEVADRRGWPPLFFIVASALCGIAARAWRSFLSQERRIAAMALGAVAGTFCCSPRSAMASAGWRVCCRGRASPNWRWRLPISPDRAG